MRNSCATIILACLSAMPNLACKVVESVETDDSTYAISEIELASSEDTIYYFKVTGKITLAGEYPGAAPTATIRFYSDEYTTLIEESSEPIGYDLETTGTVQEFELGHYRVFMLPASSGYAKVCADLQVERSNYLTTTQLGCLECTAR